MKPRYIDELRGELLRINRVSAQRLLEAHDMDTGHNYGAWMKGSPAQALKQRYSYLISLIDDPNCKRMLLDTRQMLAFEEAGEMQPHHLQLLRYPFDRFWVEFTEPLHLPSFEEGWYLRGFTITDNVKDIITIRDGKSYSPPNPAVSVMLYFTDDNNGIQDLGFVYHASTGRALMQFDSIKAELDNPADIQRWHPDLSNDDEGAMLIEAGSPQSLEDWPRNIGQHESICMQMAEILSWTLAYLMSKGLRIIQVLPPRAERRRAQKKGEIPQPWHLVELDPRFIRDSNGNGEATGGREHGYRYDVIGHLRLARRKMPDGTYRESIEWVRPHQRGLKNSLYIPKTYNVKAGKIQSPTMDKYWDER